MMDKAALLQQIAQNEQEVSEIQQQLNSLASENGESDDVLNNLVAENEKLKYQVLHLQRNIAQQREVALEHMPSLQLLLAGLFGSAIHKAFPDVGHHNVVLTPSTKEAFGDYQCNSALSLAKALKRTPRDVATAIHAQLHGPEVRHWIDKTEIAGAGFINVWLRREAVSEQLRLLLTRGVRPPHVAHKMRVVVDYSSPNIAKEMHVGHLRSTIIGDSISRLCEFLGHDVLRINHIGDWGTQFGMLIAHLRDTEAAAAAAGAPDDWSSVADLQALYRASKQHFDSDEEFKKRAYAAVVALQAHDPDTLAVWRRICAASRLEFNKVYERLGVRGLLERGESFYQSRMPAMVALLEEGGFLEEDDGRRIMWPGADTGAKVPLTVVKSDGGFTYATSDLTALRHRLDEEKADCLLYVVDAGQAVHLEGVFAAGRRAGFYAPDSGVRVEHVGFGVVLGEDRKKFKTRSGETVRLVELLDEGLTRARARLEEKGRLAELSAEEQAAVCEAVAYGCIKYADLSHSRGNDYVFSFDKMLEDKGNTAVYLLYAYTRICSIARKAQLSAAQVREGAADAERTPLQLRHPREWRLAKVLLRLPEVLLKMQADLLLHSCCDYLYELATAFTEFYDECQCVQASPDKTSFEVDWSRLCLCEATAAVMRTGFDILGLRTVERM